MKRTQGTGGLAALAGLTATIALMTGVPVANADELADLRANQELLQRRIDQLAQLPRSKIGPAGTGGAAYGTQAAPGLALVGGSFPRSFLIPGTDTSIRVGGFADLTADYWFQGGQVNGTQTTTIGNNGRALTAPLAVHGQTIPGFPTVGNVLPVDVQSSRGNGVFSMSPRETRLNVETRTPTAWGELRTFIEFDFAGSGSLLNNPTHVSDSLIPRLRYAYGTLAGFLAGQANSNFADPDASNETLDFGGDVGQAGVVRIPQVRYTIAGPWGSAWSASLETPETDLLTPAGQITTDSNGLTSNNVSSATTNGCVANGTTFNATAFSPTGTLTSICSLTFNPTKSPAPDLTFASYWAQPWGHVDFKLVGRLLQVNDGHLIDKKIFGYGGGVSGDIKPGWLGWAKDDITFQATAGDGIGRYINEGDDNALQTNFLSSPANAAAAGNIIVRPVVSFGASGGYQHWWLSNLRSNLTFGYVYRNYDLKLIGPSQSFDANKTITTVHVNLIWSPVSFIDTGIEYAWAQRTVMANIRGKEQYLVGKFRVKF